MQVLEPRTALLSNFEVSTLLSELQKEHNDAASPQHSSDNLRFIQTQTLNYLNDTHLPTTRQSELGISNLLAQLQPFPTLTRAEKLMIVNLAPKTIVELYVIVEELEDRLSQEDIDAIISIVHTTLNDPAADAPVLNGTSQNDADQPLFEDDDEEDAKYEMQVAEQEELENADVGEEEGRAIDEVDE